MNSSQQYDTITRIVNIENSRATAQLHCPFVRSLASQKSTCIHLQTRRCLFKAYLPPPSAAMAYQAFGMDMNMGYTAWRCRSPSTIPFSIPFVVSQHIPIGT